MSLVPTINILMLLMIQGAIKVGLVQIIIVYLVIILPILICIDTIIIEMEQHVCLALEI
jgi:hypothetical protein